MEAITDEELNSITRAIIFRYGIDFTNYEPTSLKRRISRIIAVYKLENILGLWRKVIYEPDFIQTFIDEVTVGLTELFRNNEFWITIKQDIFPKLNEKESISIWHAGCSTGEEVYSMAIWLSENQLLGKSKVLSTDINSKSLIQAREGKFSSAYLKTYTSNYSASKGIRSLDYYYTLKEEDMIFNKLQMNNFTFENHNLVKDPMPHSFDMIFCRNVMIYFDEQLKMKILEMFYNSLNKDSFLIIGFYDSLPNDYKKFFRVYDSACKIYKKI